MEWVPTAKPPTFKDAIPPLRVAVLIKVEPSRNVTVPVAVLGVTVAVRVTAAPYAAGFGEDETATEDVPMT